MLYRVIFSRTLPCCRNSPLLDRYRAIIVIVIVVGVSEKNPADPKPSKEHEYLGIKFDFCTKGKVKIDMTKYMNQMVSDFEKKYILNDSASTPAANDLFGNDPDSPKIDKEMREDFHTFTAKGLFAAKRGRPDTGTAISVLTRHVCVCHL